MTRAFIIVAALAALLMSSAIAEDRAVAPKVSTSVQGGYARVVFDFPDEVVGKGQVSDGVLVLSFDQAMDVDVDALTRALDGYVAMVRADPDGRALRLALKGPVRLKTTALGTRYAFDIIPPSFRGDPPAATSPTGATASKTLPVMMVRATEREKTTRLQFDFPDKINYAAKLDDGKLRVSFDKNAKVDLKRFTSTPPAWVKGARSSVEDGKLLIEFDVDPEADFHDTSEGDRIVLELAEPKSDAKAVAAAAAAAPPQAGAPKAILPSAMTAPAAVPVAASEDGAPPTILVEAINFPMPPRNGTPPAATPTPTATATAPALRGDAAAVAAGDHSDDDGTKLTFAGDQSALPPTLRLGRSDLETALAPIPAASPATPGKARAEFFGAMLRIELPYSKLPAAAVFRRGLAVWVVMASPEVMDLSALAALPNAPARVLSMPTRLAPNITAFRLETSAVLAVSAAAAGNSWIIAIGNTVPDVPTQLQLVRQTAGTQTKLRAYIPGVDQVVWVKDPQTEDRIAAVLAYAPARGLASGRSFVELAALPSQQGLAIQAVSDDLTVGVEGNEVVLSRPNGLNISNAQFAQTVSSVLPVAQVGVSPAYADFAAWGKPIAETEAEAIRKLMRLSSQSPGGMSPARMSLARYYIANGFGAEALGVLTNVAREDRTADANPSFRAARAIANILMARYRDAMTDLSMDVMGSDPHAAMWRGLAAAGLHDWRLARNNLMSALKIVNRYPAAWEARVRVALATAALAMDEPASATQALAGMPQLPLPVDVSAGLMLVRAELDVVSNKIDSAIAAYDRLASSDYRPIAVRAQLDGTLLKVAQGRIKPEQAIDALERLRYQWRGDDVELKTLTELGRLYVENHRVRDGLNTMRLAVRHFNTSDEARTTAQQMAKIFEQLFLGGKADEIKAMDALALFYDFRELTPVGPQGDEMIRRLSERLVSVDLLPQAAELLQHQVDNRLDGIPKASVATRLALVYLLDRKAEKALNAIRTTKQTRLPDDLIAQRNLIEARALADLKMYDDALDVVSTDMGPEADRLRADVLWDAQRWGDAAARSEALLGTRYNDLTPLTDVERQDIMRASVAYSLAGDGGSLERLRTRFDSKMQQTPDGKAFAMVTQSADVTSGDYKNLVKRVAGVDTLDAFLQDFRSRYGKGGIATPSAATPIAPTPVATPAAPQPLASSAAN